MNNSTVSKERTRVIRLLREQKRHIGDLFAALEGNARVIVITEGIAAISFQWVGTYLPLYMLALGVDKLQVGVLSSVLILTKLISTLLGGYMADRFGRKQVLVLFDIVCWGIPMLLYAIAQNPWYFVIGRLINGFVYVVLPSFDCLFVEDVPVERRTAVFGAFSLLTAAASLLAPVAGVLVAQMGIVSAGRLIMATCMVSSVSIAIVRQFTMRETSMGRERMTAVQGVPVLTLIREYAETIRAAVRIRQVRTFLTVRNLGAFVTTMWMTYSVIYLTDARGVGLAESSVAGLPFVSAVVSMVMILLAAERLTTKRVYGSLIAGQMLWLLGALFFVFAPTKTIGLVILWAIFSALSTALFRPAEQSYWANLVTDRERAQMFSASSALMSLVSLPAGPLAGALYIRFSKGPFLLGIALQVVSLGLVLSIRDKPSKRIGT
ncbi:MAG: MFS transporter [Anaerolineae bacterium]|nr:MFS transporter [Anaerolineae bacterium]